MHRSFECSEPRLVRALVGWDREHCLPWHWLYYLLTVKAEHPHFS